MGSLRSLRYAMKGQSWAPNPFHLFFVLYYGHEVSCSALCIACVVSNNETPPKTKPTTYRWKPLTLWAQTNSFLFVLLDYLRYFHSDGKPIDREEAHWSLEYWVCLIQARACLLAKFRQLPNLTQRNMKCPCIWVVTESVQLEGKYSIPWVAMASPVVSPSCCLVCLFLMKTSFLQGRKKLKQKRTTKNMLTVWDPFALE